MAQGVTDMDSTQCLSDLAVCDYEQLPVLIQVSNNCPAILLNETTLQSTLNRRFSRYDIESSDFRTYFARENYSIHDAYPDHYLEIHVQIETHTYHWQLAFHREVLYPLEKITYIYSNVPAWQRQGHGNHEQRAEKIISNVVRATDEFINFYQQANCHSN